MLCTAKPEISVSLISADDLLKELENLWSATSLMEQVHAKRLLAKILFRGRKPICVIGLFVVSMSISANFTIGLQYCNQH